MTTGDANWKLARLKLEFADSDLGTADLAALFGVTRTAVRHWCRGTGKYGAYQTAEPYGQGHHWRFDVNQVRVGLGMVPIDKTNNRTMGIEDALILAVQHDKKYPTHGPNCICMDELIRATRQRIMRRIPKTGDTLKVRSRLRHIISTAMNQL